MEDGLEGRITAGSDPLSALRLAASARLRQDLGAEGLAKASPMQLAERANDVLESLVAAHAIKPSLGDQRQLLRDVVETLRLERTAAAPAPVETPVAADPLYDPARRERGPERTGIQEQARDPGQGAGDAAPDAAHRHLRRFRAGS